jgi:hypothetical protein
MLSTIPKAYFFMNDFSLVVFKNNADIKGLR